LDLAAQQHGANGAEELADDESGRVLRANTGESVAERARDRNGRVGE
jgi:hypothetical protein